MPDLLLFPAEPLLEKRLGKDLFEGIPEKPGIYRFYDSGNELLYVGKAKNLRKRLFSYKRVRAGSTSQKVSKMVSLISRFEVEITGSEREALLMENRWIREKRPPFNYANKQTEAYYFVYLNSDDEKLEFRLTMSIDDGDDMKNWYGCFKGHAPVRRSLGCLLQLLWLAEHSVVSPHLLPVQLTRRLTPLHYNLTWQISGSPALHDSVPGMIRSWLLGESCEILEWLVVQIECGCMLTRFENRFLEDRLEHLKNFYDRKLIRHRTIRSLRTNPSDHIIQKDELDDLIVMAGLHRVSL